MIPRVDDPAPVPVDHDVIKRVADSLKKGLRDQGGHGGDSRKAYARFLVRATTGQRPAQIGYAEPEDVDLKRRIWYVRPCKGGHQIPLPLSTEGVFAWQTFIKAHAWGKFDCCSFAKTLRRHGWPETITPYRLRHTFAIDYLRDGGRLEDLQGLLGHKSIETTRKHYAPVLLSLLQKEVNRRKLRLAK
jgi:integrase